MADFDPVISECLSRPIVAGAARRLFHGRGHCFPGYEDLCVDRYGSRVLVSSFTADGARARSLAALLVDALDGVEGVCVQHRQGRATVTEVITGDVPEEVVVDESGLKFLVQPLRNQNVGLFLDMAPTRAWLRDTSRNRRVLNLFSFTCAFSVAALAGGASHVVNNDMSRPALDWGRRNHALNDQDPRQVSMLGHNLFRSWRAIGELGPYGTVIIDPPTNQRGSFNAEKQYGQVLKRLPVICSPGADIIACLNSPFLGTDFVTAQMSRWCPTARFESQMEVSEDFPDRFPERALKILRFRYPG